MQAAKTEYLWQQILSHTRLFFSPEARQVLESGLVVFRPYDQAIQTGRPAVAVPTDIPAPTEPQMPYQVPFNGTNITLWNPIPRPVADGWNTVPDENTPLWYRHRSGTVIPAWNLARNILDLLTFREERESKQRDVHGRFNACFSPRLAPNLLEVPAFNEAVAALVAACVGLRHDGVPALRLDGLLEPPAIILSHDCDSLRGNDSWTQMVRIYRVIEPVRHARAPHLRNLWWAAGNVLSPRRFYLNNVAGMIGLERQFGFTSTFYLLNGRKGRFGARSGSALIPEVVRMIPEGWDIGMHYNYDTFLNRDRFEEQRRELATITSTIPAVGRAHYLRFDPERSPAFLELFGVRCDESAGYPDRIGYRCGIGGCFRTYDTALDEPLHVWEVPLTIMDATLMNQYEEASVGAFSRLLSHLGRVGGALSLVVHPGLFHNPEFPRMLGLYHRLLIEARQVGARSIPARKLVEMAAGV